MMRISTKGRYALRIMLDLARHEGREPVSLRAMAERQNITPKYMESIMALLLKEQLVVSVRGKGGGYHLTRTPEQYKVYDILCAAEGDISPVQCLAQPVNSCPMQATCSTLPLWEGLDRVVREYLSGISLADVLHKDGELSFCAGI